MSYFQDIFITQGDESFTARAPYHAGFIHEAKKLKPLGV